MASIKNRKEKVRSKKHFKKLLKKHSKKMKKNKRQRVRTRKIKYQGGENGPNDKPDVLSTIAGHVRNRVQNVKDQVDKTRVGMLVKGVYHLTRKIGKKTNVEIEKEIEELNKQISELNNKKEKEMEEIKKKINNQIDKLNKKIDKLEKEKENHDNNSHVQGHPGREEPPQRRISTTCRISMTCRISIYINKLRCINN